jgi:flagellin-like hook-associated protein FlgL
MRRQVRGLNQGTANARDGISWSQIGDGALHEVSDILHRMKELTIKSMNETLTDTDRSYLQAEFSELQNVIDGISKNTTFNEQPVFEEHEPTYYQIVGNRRLAPDQPYVVTAGQDTLEITYRKEKDGPLEEITITVPPGRYTIRELMSEIEDAMGKATNANGETATELGFNVEYKNGVCNLNYEGGFEIYNVGGKLSDLFYYSYTQGSLGSLLGTTNFNNRPLDVKNSENGQLEFTLIDINGESVDFKFELDDGSYSRAEVIELLNEEFIKKNLAVIIDKDLPTERQYGIRAEVYDHNGSQSIKIVSEDYYITGLKGNMFKIDDLDLDPEVYNSVFYDNIKYGKVDYTPAVFTGGAVLVNDPNDTRHNRFVITDDNNKLRLSIDGGDTYTTVTLTNGSYTNAQMVTHLQSVLNTALGPSEVRVSEISASAGGKTFWGLELETYKTGLDYQIVFDRSEPNNAYDTLFVNRIYSNFQTATPVNGRTASAPFWRGGTNFGTGSGANLPLIIDATNDRFNLTVNGTTRTIVLEHTSDHKTYKTLDDILAEINKQITAVGWGGLVEAVDAGAASASIAGEYKLAGRILFQAEGDNPALASVSASAYITGGVTNQGYNRLFGYNYTYTEGADAANPKAANGTATTLASITLDLVPEPGTQFTGTNRWMIVNVNGVDRPVDLSTLVGEYGSGFDLDDIVSEINSQIGSELDPPHETINKPAPDYQEGSDQPTGSGSGTGETTPRAYAEYGVGTGIPPQGENDDSNLTAASVTVRYALPASPSTYTITSGPIDRNDALEIRVNGTLVHIDIPAGNYTAAELRDEIQRLLNDHSFTKQDANKVIVGLDSSNRLTFTTDRKGITRTIAIEESTSNTFFRILSATKTQATARLEQTVQNDIRFTNPIASNTFSFTVTTGGAETTQTVNIPTENYNRTTFLSTLNGLLSSYGVTASYYGNQLQLTTNAAGAGNAISFGTSMMAPAVATAIYGAAKPAELTLSLPVKDGPIAFQTGDVAGDRVFRLSVNGTLRTVTLAASYANAEALRAALNTGFSAYGVTVSLSATNQLVFTTTTVGESANLSFSATTPTNTDAAMRAIFGAKYTEVSGVEAKNVGGKLVLTNKEYATEQAQSISFRWYDNANQFFINRIPTTSSLAGTASTTGLTEEKARIGHQNTNVPYGVNATAKTVTIDSKNNTMTFRFMPAASAAGNRTITVVAGTYSYDDLKAEIIKQLGEMTGGTIETGKSAADYLDVFVTERGITLQAKTAETTTYNMSTFSGGMYDYLVAGGTITEQELKPDPVPGGQDIHEAYAVGRQDIRNGSVQIIKGVNDTLSLDLDMDGDKRVIEFTLDPGSYQGESLIKQIQTQLDKALAAEGLEPGLIRASLGGVNSGVVGSNDNNALVFSLSKDHVVPTDGTYIIDGVRGTAAFYVFYKTEGIPIPNYVIGATDITNVTIVDGRNEFEFQVNGEPYSYTIPPGNYTGEELIEILNDLFEADPSDPPVKASIDGGKLRLGFSVFGPNIISHIGGSAKGSIFYVEKGRVDGKDDLNIIVGAEASDSINLKKQKISTTNLGINAIAISQYKYAAKALDRLKSGLYRLMTSRSYFGSTQNRLEHTVAVNKNTAENTTAAESRIRDTDMAQELVRNTMLNLLQQTGQTMLSQANQRSGDVLVLLR